MKIKNIVRGLVSAFGYEIRHVPRPLLDNPNARLLMDFCYLIDAIMFRRGNDFFFIQIGAHDGISNDPIHHYIENYNWHGILVEPQADVVSVLRKTYADQSQLLFENIAISDHDGIMELFSVKNTKFHAPDWLGQQASVNRDHLLRLHTKLPDIQQMITSEFVECMTLEALCNKHRVDRIDLLQIDTEGHDSVILLSTDFSRLQPAVIQYEHKHLSREVQDSCLVHLIDHGYSVLELSGFDTLAFKPQLYDTWK